MSIQVQDLEAYLKKRSDELGFSHFGLTTLSRPFSFEIYQSWLQNGMHGNMEYLKTHAPIKAEPQLRWPEARSALVFAVPYFPHPAKNQEFPVEELRVSLYAQGYDYHHWFQEKLQSLCTDLKLQFPNEDFIPMADSSPVLERDLAHRAGLGWVAKNTCVIHPKKGSLFFLGEIYSSLSLAVEPAPLPDFCGTCTRCMEICPTNAIVEPRKLDARKCISYLTIESRELPPENLRPLMGDWFFGCDLCQTVCPWNQKLFKNQLTTDLVLSNSNTGKLEEELRWILTSSGKQLEKAFKGTPLARAGSFGLRRNALLVVSNRRIASLSEEVQNLLEHPKLGELARWTLKSLSNSPVDV